MTELTKHDEYDLNSVRVMHMLHELESEMGDLSTTVRLGFKWAEAGEGQELFLCVCNDRCTDPEMCGRAFAKNVELENPARESEGHTVQVKMPWIEDGEPLVFDVWCCSNCEVKATGAIQDIWVGRFFDLPARLLSFEHEERSRSYRGLFDSMRKAYGDSFGESSFVTVVLYRRAT